jgi:hypothetical protein
MPFPLMVSVSSFVSTVELAARIIVLFDRLKPVVHQDLACSDIARILGQDRGCRGATEGVTGD